MRLLILCVFWLSVAAGPGLLAAPARAQVGVDEAITYDFNYAARGPKSATAWYGKELAVVVEGVDAQTYDLQAMKQIIELMTRVRHTFEDLTGLKDLPLNGGYKGRYVIQVPADNNGAGGLAHHGVLGISVGRGFFNRFHDRVKRGRIAVDQVWLYEMNRNYFHPRWNDHIDWVMDNQPGNWGFWTVGINNAAAVYITDTLEIGLEYFGHDRAAFKEIMADDYRAYRDGDYTFDNAWTRRVMPWRAEDGQTINDLMSGTLLHWYDHFGGEDFMRRLFAEIPNTPKMKDRFDYATARDNWYRIVSRASGANQLGYFTGELKWEISAAAAREIAAELGGPGDGANAP